MFFHGGNDSRLAGGLLEAAAIATGVRLICPERPGFGRSTYQPGRNLLDWSSDVEQLADRLDLGRFRLVGHSGGGPHALACAAALPERITRVAAVSSVAPPIHSEWFIESTKAPWARPRSASVNSKSSNYGQG